MANTKLLWCCILSVACSMRVLPGGLVLHILVVSSMKNLRNGLIVMMSSGSDKTAPKHDLRKQFSIEVAVNCQQSTSLWVVSIVMRSFCIVLFWYIWTKTEFPLGTPRMGNPVVISPSSE